MRKGSPVASANSSYLRTVSQGLQLILTSLYTETRGIPAENTRDFNAGLSPDDLPHGGRMGEEGP